MVGIFEDSTQSKEWASRRAACIWRRDTQGKFYGTLFRKLSASFMNSPGLASATAATREPTS